MLPLFSVYTLARLTPLTSRNELISSRTARSFWVKLMFRSMEYARTCTEIAPSPSKKAATHSHDRGSVNHRNKRPSHITTSPGCGAPRVTKKASEIITTGHEDGRNGVV